MLKLRKNKKGFTLVELIVVIAIMAVLAGVVAGVTVSQLNKQPDKTGRTQANTIAQFISECVLTAEKPSAGETLDEYILKQESETSENLIFDSDKVSALMTKQYSAASIKVNPESGDKGIITVTTAEDGSKVTVEYKSKASGGGIKYEVNVAGIVSKVA